jgi:hypothetical protein
MHHRRVAPGLQILDESFQFRSQGLGAFGSAIWLRKVKGSGAGDTGDTFLKQNRSTPRAPPLGQEHEFASGRTRGRPGRPPVGPAPPAREAPTWPRVPSAAPRPPDARPAVSTPCGPVRAYLAGRSFHPLCCSLRRSHLTPRKPKETAGGSNLPSPTEEERTGLWGYAIGRNEASRTSISAGVRIVGNSSQRVLLKNHRDDRFAHLVTTSRWHFCARPYCKG